MTTSTTMNLFKTLLNAGVAPTDAEELEKHFEGEPDFLDGLEQIAQIMALKELPGLVPPTGEPWRSIHENMSQDMANGEDADTAWRNAIAKFDPAVAIAITGALNLRMKVILDFEQQKGKKKRVKTIEYVKVLQHQLGYDFKLNECTDNIEVNGSPIHDHLAAQIRSQMRDLGFERSQVVEDAYVSLAFQQRYHPVRQYLTSLNYDGGNYIAELASFFKDKYGMFPIWLRKWMIGACAKVFEAEQNPMLVLDGRQGIGKSEFVKWLAKPLQDYFIEAPINTEDKDSDIRLFSYWIWEVSELGATTRRADYEALKAFLTKRKVTVRKPYGHYDINKPAMASFIGTVNNSSGILNDPTGSRRFHISHLEGINWDYTSIEPDLVWAEAMAAYLARESWQLTKDEEKRAQEINEEYEITDPVEDLIRKHFKIQVGNQTWWMPTADILSILEDPFAGGLKGNTRSNAMALAGAMKKIGLEKKKQRNSNGQPVWGYVGIAYGP
ncbi:hypothetical protein ADN00_18845 [Ornatilinea apprima]|uniref:Virulence-associated protein E-like domain-containing protein n=1 Tax=Ornatilinea apprima TaxID=1134406 RepID=A0A0P6WTJ1_9CHLR|nr:VapE domain-containing protein [Ornatilinea apprima]KPL70102.1 hypothetical protein ADN00_18845 [Ornatilinea apprima]